jgi:hypothetical protein
VEHLLSPTRLSQLEGCMPSPGAEALKQAMLNTALLGHDVCETLATKYERTWPREAAEEVIRMVTNA